MPNELKPCPICGSRVVVAEFERCNLQGYPVNQYHAKIICSCGLTFERVWEEQTTLNGSINLSTDIVTAWNGRVENGSKMELENTPI